MSWSKNRREVVERRAWNHLPSPPTPLPQGEGRQTNTNARQNGFELLENLAIREAEHGEPCGAQETITDSVAHGSREMKFTVEFDDEPGFFGEEVHDERAPRLLSSEFDAAQSATAQGIP